jgi:hypothetical protein
MSYQVTEKNKTLSGKWQVRVVIDANTSTFLSFPTEPTQAEVDREAEAWDLNRRLAELRNQPVPEVYPEAPTTKLSKLDYMNRFTEAELATIYTVAKANVAVEVWLEKFKLASDIDLADPRTIGGVQALEAAGLLSAGRAGEILA